MMLVVVESGADKQPAPRRARKDRAKDINRAIGDAVEAVRLETDLTQEQLAERLGIQLQMYSRYRRGKNVWTVPLLVEVAAALEVDPVVFLTRAELSSEVVDPVSAVSQSDLIAPHRRLAIDLIRSLRKAAEADG